MALVGISVVINTLNEERNLFYALRSVQTWADEIVVIDMYSEDRTVEVARTFGAKVHYHERTGYADPARGFGLSQAAGDWILILDADELIPLPLSRKLREIAASDAADVVQIHRVNYLLGAPLAYTGWGPHQDKHARFFKRGFLEADATIHDYLKPVPAARILDLPFKSGSGIIHFNYLDTAHFLEKLNRYTTIEAQQARERGEQVEPLKALVRSAREFKSRFITHRGYRDGWRGFYLSLFMAFYRLATYAKLKELSEIGPPESVQASYRQEAERLVSEYEKHSDECSAANAN